MWKLEPEFNQYKSDPNSHLSGWCKWKSQGRLSHVACSGNFIRPHQLSFPCPSPRVQAVQCLWCWMLCSTSSVQHRSWWSVGQWQRTGLLVTGLSLPAPPPCPSCTFSLILKFVYWVSLPCPTSCSPCTDFGKTASVQWGFHSEAQL